MSHPLRPATLYVGALLAVCLCALAPQVVAAQTQPAPAEVQAAADAIAKHEPTIDELLSALHHALEGERGARVQALLSRARTAGWVPTVGLKARRGQAVDLASTTAGDALRLSTDDTLTLEAALTFDLGRVVFAREEVALAREARSHDNHVEDLRRELIKLYFERRRLLIERALARSALATREPDGRAAEPQDAAVADTAAEPAQEPARDRSSRAGNPTAQVSRAARTRAAPDASAVTIAREVRIAELEALLDTFTGGAFRRIMATRRHIAAP